MERTTPHSALEIDAATPEGRDRFVDLLRAASIGVVVLGHWLLAIVTLRVGQLTGRNALAVIPKVQILTWILQVMPLFFFAGGLSNAVSLRAARARGEGYGDFLRRRFARLMKPTMVFAGVWFCVAWLMVLAGVPAARVRVIASTVAIPLWFLAVYLILILVAPCMHRLHERFGGTVLVVLGAGALVVDVAHRSVPWVGIVNFALVWLLPHQLGFFYADGSLVRAGRRMHAAMAAGAFAILLVLTMSGVSPLSMVGVPGARASNNSPPSFALAMHCVWLIGVAMLVRSKANARLAKPRVWARVVKMNLVAMTLFLWHMTALVIGAYILLPLGFPQPAAGSLGWWALRPVWLACLLAILGVFVLVLGRVEATARGSTSGGPRTARVTLGSIACTLAMVGFARTGFAPGARGALGIALLAGGTAALR